MAKPNDDDMIVHESAGNVSPIWVCRMPGRTCSRSRSLTQSPPPFTRKA
jgi:hypothetical protein